MIPTPAAVEQEFTLAETLEAAAEPVGDPIEVTLSNDLAQLLSKQLYRSPLKAVEELVVNAYDADAEVCRLFVPGPSDVDRRFILIFDDGVGMDKDGLQQLWQIGRSGKRIKDDLTRRFQRKQIGRFGIGKLATFTVANRLTYVTKAAPLDEKGETQDGGEILAVSIDFRVFMEEVKATTLAVRKVDDWAEISQHPNLAAAADASGVDLQKLPTMTSWTLAFLEELNEEAGKLQLGKLRRVLRTAMPLRAKFNLWLNNEVVTSSKIDTEWLVEFDLADLPKSRLDNLKEATGTDWSIASPPTSKGKIAPKAHATSNAPENAERRIVSDLFPIGISGRVWMGLGTLTGKSDDLARSHGFFVYVRGRLINAEDPLFGLDPLSYESFNRMHAVIRCDDLDEDLTAPREGVEDSARKAQFEIFLNEVFNEARAKLKAALKPYEDKNDRNKEPNRNFVNPTLVEYPIADAITLSSASVRANASEADGGWFYLKVDSATDHRTLLRQLYAERVDADERRQYAYVYTNMGPQGRVVKFNPITATFEINEAHAFVQHHFDTGRSQSLLEDILTAEALLEVYLREAGIPTTVVGSVLERRDTLLKSLARDRPYSLRAIAENLRDSADDEHDLEIALIAAARSLGFVAAHVSGPDTPDGVARYIHYPEGERKITLEAKSSKNVPSLSAIDFAGLYGHMVDEQAQGCLLVAPGYPGSTREDDARAAKSAQQQRISCWTVEQLARFVEQAEEKKLSASDILDIVLSRFSPDQVSNAIDALLAERVHFGPELYRKILKILADLEERMPLTEYRRIENIHTALIYEGFHGISRDAVEDALRDLVHTSKGAFVLRDDRFLVVTSLEEAGRRVTELTKEVGSPRRPSRFRASND
jgi:hypothetical protein